jgi:hypothetical protein
MPNDAESDQQRDLATRTFATPSFAILWAIFLGGILMFVAWPIRNIALVCWIYGRDGYFQQGIRVLPGKPITFSDGALVPLLPDLITGFAFFTAVGGLSLLAILALRLYERHLGRRATPAPDPSHNS